MEMKNRTSMQYIEGSAARQLNPAWEIPEQEERGLQRVIQPEIQKQPKEHKKPKVGHGIDFISMLLLVTAIVATVLVCMEYLQVQSDIVQLNKSVLSIEGKITAAEKENNALQAVINATTSDLEYVYQIAVGTLGMVYPNHNEVVYYQQNEDGYFRQYQDIPQ